MGKALALENTQSAREDACHKLRAAYALVNTLITYGEPFAEVSVLSHFFLGLVMVLIVH